MKRSKFDEKSSETPLQQAIDMLAAWAQALSDDEDFEDFVEETWELVNKLKEEKDKKEKVMKKTESKSETLTVDRAVKINEEVELEPGDKIQVYEADTKKKGKKTEMTRRTALQLDKENDGAIYVDYEETTGDYGVFGTESGFMYRGFPDEDDAIDWAESFAENNDIDFE